MKLLPITPPLIGGIDDATKCPCIGSIFIAGVVATQETIDAWKELGVKDSKLLSPKKREKLAQIIKKTATRFSIKQITPQMIDDKTLNLNEWEMLVVFTIIQSLLPAGMPEKMYIDNWETTQKGFFARQEQLLDAQYTELLRTKKMRVHRKKLRTVHLIPEHRADENYTVVGAASILAKTASDAQYKKLKKQYGDFGSGSPADPKTRLFVFEHRHNPPPIIRQSWNTYKMLKECETIEQDPYYRPSRTIGRKKSLPTVY